MPHCCAINCSSAKGVSVFKLPRKDRQRCDQWIRNINRESLPQNVVICEKHFTEDQFENRTDRKLKWNAVPTIFDFKSQQKPNSKKRRKLDPTLDLSNEKISVTEQAAVTEMSAKIGLESNIPDSQTQILSLQHQLLAAHNRIEAVTKQNSTLMNNLRKVFESDQIEQLSGNTKNGVKWSEESMQKYLKLYLACGTAGYEELIRQNYPLPSIRTLQRKIRSFQYTPAIEQKISNFTSDL